MKKLGYLSFLAILSMFLLFWNGCGSSRKTVDESGTTSQGQAGEDEFDEIERLLGISRDDSKQTESSSTRADQQTSQSGQEDDLIRLLEVDEGKPKEQPTVQTAGVEDKRVTRLQSQVDDMQKELRKKDMEIADLKTQLTLKQESLARQQKSTTTSSDAAYYSTGSQQTASTYTPPPASDSYGEQYQNTLALFHTREYQQAIAGFEDLLAQNMNHSYSDNAQYWIGECYYAMGRFREAIMAFEKVFTFPNSNKNDYAQFKIGQCYFKLGDKERARQEFQQLIDNYPESELAPRARNYLAQS
jgi:tol-pal system protein YbgF